MELIVAVIILVRWNRSGGVRWDGDERRKSEVLLLEIKKILKRLRKKWDHEFYLYQNKNLNKSKKIGVICWPIK